ncbi:hypothetical protein [Flavobacterium lindanitolerans]|uniref:Uncharacterized protein n=1 Tax=Flavobacterium lindanitolerans TaxID=428988 RepID=A0A497UPU4_9FLAO|nr:hypothetical protein [Flavobacterium lindanitolerans]PKW20873.1 hypothetical protein B0G92_2152 [Flavobacterium lindanitolerans]RLJ30488.1 hypothetical protein CLV50_1898 [Flavobacterium lindanitolerans]
MNSYYLIFNTSDTIVSAPDLEQAYSKYSELQINDSLKESIKKRIDSKKDFEISVSELKLIAPSFEKRIEELLKHPFKEKLRLKYPEQYGSQPFVYNGTTYYLYHKGREFYIDGLIYKVLYFKKLVEEYRCK